MRDQGGYVFAVFDERVLADRAVEELAGAGLGIDHVDVFVGEDGARAIAERDEVEDDDGSWWKRLLGAGTRVHENDAREYEEAARAGACVLAIRIEEAGHERIEGILRTHNARLARAYSSAGDRTAISADGAESDRPT